MSYPHFHLIFPQQTHLMSSVSSVFLHLLFTDIINEVKFLSKRVFFSWFCSPSLSLTLKT